MAIHMKLTKTEKDRIPNFLLLLLLLLHSIETEEEKPNILMAATFRIPCQIKRRGT